MTKIIRRSGRILFIKNEPSFARIMFLVVWIFLFFYPQMLIIGELLGKLSTHEIDTDFWFLIFSSLTLIFCVTPFLILCILSVSLETIEINSYCVIHMCIGLPWYKRVIRLSNIDCLAVTEEIDDESKSYGLKLIINSGEKKKEINLYVHDSQDEILTLSKELSQLMGIRRVLPKHLRSSA